MSSKRLVVRQPLEDPPGQLLDIYMPETLRRQQREEGRLVIGLDLIVSMQAISANVLASAGSASTRRQKRRDRSRMSV
jgi:hypothetical protein